MDAAGIAPAIEAWLQACSTPDGEPAARADLLRRLGAARPSPPGAASAGMPSEPLQPLPDDAAALFEEQLQQTLDGWLDQEGGVPRILGALPAVAGPPDRLATWPAGLCGAACRGLTAALEWGLAEAQAAGHGAFEEAMAALTGHSALSTILRLTEMGLAAAAAAPAEELPALRAQLAASELLTLVDDTLFYEQDLDREEEAEYKACMAALSFPGLARLLDGIELLKRWVTRHGKGLLVPSLNAAVSSCLAWWLGWGAGKEAAVELPEHLAAALVDAQARLLLRLRPIASSAGLQAEILQAHSAVLSKCPALQLPYWRSMPLTAAAAAVGVCLRRARLADIARRDGTLDGGPLAGAHVNSGTAAATSMNRIFSTADDALVLDSPARLRGVLQGVREAAAGEWADAELAESAWMLEEVAHEMQLEGAHLLFSPPRLDTGWADDAEAIVAADAQLLELLVGMAADEVDAAEAAAAAAAEAEASSEGGGGGSADSPASPSHSSTPSEPCSEVCLGTEGSRRALACLLLRSMARSAYITATPGPAAAFLRRFASLAVGPQADQSCAWFAQRLLLPVLRLLAVLSPDQDWATKEAALSAVAAAVPAICGLPPGAGALGPRGTAPALLAAMDVMRACAASPAVQGGAAAAHFLRTGCLPAAMRCLQEGMASLDQASGYRLVDAALHTAAALAFPSCCRPDPQAVVTVRVVQPEQPRLLRQAALQLAASVSPGELLRAAAAVREPPAPPAGPVASTAGAAAAEALGAGQGGEAQEGPAPLPAAPADIPAAAAAAIVMAAAAAAVEGVPPGALAALAMQQEQLEQVMGLLLEMQLGPGDAGPPTNFAASEATLPLAAVVTHDPAARAALVEQPGALETVARLLQASAPHRSQELQAAHCALVLTAVARHPGGGQALVDSGAVDALLAALHAAVGRQELPPVLGVVSLWSYCLVALAVCVDQEVCPCTALCSRIAAASHELRGAAAGSQYVVPLEDSLRVAEMVADGASWGEVLAEHHTALQGTACAAAGLLHRALGDPAPTVRAVQLTARIVRGFGLARYRWPTLVGDIANALHQLDQLVPAVQPEGQPEAADEPRPPTVVQADVAFLCSSGVMPALLTCLHWMAAEPWVTHRLDTARPGQPALQHRLLAFLCGAARQGGGVGAALLESGVEEVVEAVRRGAPSGGRAWVPQQAEAEQQACDALAAELLAVCLASSGQ